MTYVAATIIALVALSGVGLTLMTLPGIWIMIATATLIDLLWMDLYNPWTLAAAFALAILAEIVELLASAVGTNKAGGTKHGAIWSIVGAIVGAILGSFMIPIPILGTIAGGVIGAGGAAIAAELAFGKKNFQEATKIGTGAAVGRLFSTILKTGFAITIAALLIVAAFL